MKKRIQISGLGPNRGELLVKGNYQATGSGFQADFRLLMFNRGGCCWKQYSGGGDHKKMVHRFADEILYLLTGEWFFQTQIAFVSTTRGKRVIWPILTGPISID
jgi:hypothetical protein